MRYELKHLQTFVAVAEELNFHRAAERLMKAQPAVSRIIVELEERLGVKLLERTTRRVGLTEAGRHLLSEAQAILARMASAEKTVRLLASGTKAILRVGYTTISGHSLVPDIAREYRNQNPDVRLELTYMTSPAMRDQILQDEIDLGFVVGPFQNAEIESRAITRHAVMALLHPDHPLAKKDIISVEELSREELIIGTNAEWPTFRRVVVDMFQNAGCVMNVGQEAATLTGILGLVTAGAGATIFSGIPRFCGNAIVARPIAADPPAFVETHLAWRRSAANAAMMRFVETSERVGKTYNG